MIQSKECRFRIVIRKFNQMYSIQILAACNPRGFREIELTAEIDYVKPQIVEMLEKTV